MPKAQPARAPGIAPPSAPAPERRRPPGGRSSSRREVGCANRPAPTHSRHPLRHNPRITQASGLSGVQTRMGVQTPLALSCLILVMNGAMAQAPAPSQSTPQQSYERQLAFCNSGRLPEPQRDACVRDAGRQLDQALGKTPGNVVRTTPDGRATVVTPSGLPVPDSGSSETTSKDGRSTIVLPADQPSR